VKRTISVSKIVTQQNMVIKVFLFGCFLAAALAVYPVKKMLSKPYVDEIIIDRTWRLYTGIFDIESSEIKVETFLESPPCPGELDLYDPYVVSINPLRVIVETCCVLPNRYEVSLDLLEYDEKGSLIKRDVLLSFDTKVSYPQLYIDGKERKWLVMERVFEKRTSGFPVFVGIEADQNFSKYRISSTETTSIIQFPLLDINFFPTDPRIYLGTTIDGKPLGYWFEEHVSAADHNGLTFLNKGVIENTALGADFTRNAGQPFSLNGRLYNPIMINTPQYGSGIRVAEVNTLFSPSATSEGEKLFSNSRNVSILLPKGKETVRYDGFHHMSVVKAISNREVKIVGDISIVHPIRLHGKKRFPIPKSVRVREPD
jgi:hypothetical protein